MKTFVVDVASSLRRKRVLNSITSNACTNCKRAKEKFESRAPFTTMLERLANVSPALGTAQCDGQKSACKRCMNRGQKDDCEYELHTKTQKEAMIREIKDLREKNNWVDMILKAIRTDERNEIIQCLRNGEFYGTISQSLRNIPFPGFTQLSLKSQLQLTKAVAEYGLEWDGERNAGSLLPGSGWTKVTSNEDLIDHLLALYFTWIHPGIESRTGLEVDIAVKGRGRRDGCVGKVYSLVRGVDLLGGRADGVEYCKAGGLAVVMRALGGWGGRT